MEHIENQNDLIYTDRVDDCVIVCYEASQACGQIITPLSHVGMSSQNPEPVSDVLNHACRDF